MKVLVKKESKPGRWLQDVPEPQTGINDALIRVDRTGIRGTGHRIYKWDAWAQKPFSPESIHPSNPVPNQPNKPKNPKQDMRKILLKALLLALLTTRAMADYSNTVMSLSPLGYWRLNETNLPPADVATNSGTLGGLSQRLLCGGGDASGSRSARKWDRHGSYISGYEQQSCGGPLPADDRRRRAVFR